MGRSSLRCPAPGVSVCPPAYILRAAVSEAEPHHVFADDLHPLDTFRKDLWLKLCQPQHLAGNTLQLALRYVLCTAAHFASTFLGAARPEDILTTVPGRPHKAPAAVRTLDFCRKAGQLKVEIFIGETAKLTPPCHLRLHIVEGVLVNDP